MVRSPVDLDHSLMALAKCKESRDPHQIMDLLQHSSQKAVSDNPLIVKDSKEGYHYVVLLELLEKVKT